MAVPVTPRIVTPATMFDAMKSGSLAAREALSVHCAVLSSVQDGDDAANDPVTPKIFVPDLILLAVN